MTKKTEPEMREVTEQENAESLGQKIVEMTARLTGIKKLQLDLENKRLDAERAARYERERLDKQESLDNNLAEFMHNALDTCQGIDEVPAGELVLLVIHANRQAGNRGYGVAPKDSIKSLAE